MPFMQPVAVRILTGLMRPTNPFFVHRVSRGKKGQNHLPSSPLNINMK
ncbi:hypothetical protein HMPREF3038_02311 [Akkermansia sp. KLE1797]|nr:hypothetical protein HMPREF3038_02311 [Akkermansia sp. KLE1797]KXU53712.1 hypothetical protein HMPREF3039_02158 [Akkermansia sp. KLE1798]KZA03888.1 hypothetical protein HMPREF1326_02428 [Akkermansia sp. KLE1605]